MIDPPATTPRRVTDPASYKYLSFTLSPDGNLLAERVPVDHVLSTQEWRDNYDQLVAQTELALLTPSGKELWVWPARHPISALLCAADGAVYCIVPPSRHDDPAAKSTVYALTPEGAVRWELEITDTLRSAASLALSDDGTLYLAGATGMLYAVSTAGEVKWGHAASTRVLGISDNFIAVGDFGRLLITDNGDVIYSAGGDRHVYCVRPDGRRRWRFTPHRDFTLFMAFAPNSSLYITDHYGWLFKLDADGNRVWSRKIDTWAAAEIAVDSSGNIYCACKGLDMLVLDPGGKELFRGRLPGFPSGVALGGNGTFYCTTNAAPALGGKDSALYMLEPSSTLR